MCNCWSLAGERSSEMNPVRIAALAKRIVEQFRRDRRTLGLLFIAPLVILGLLGYLLRSQETTTLALGISNQDQPVAPLNLSLAARLVDALKTNDRLVVTPLSGDANAVREAVRNGTVDAALVFSP